MKKKIGGVAKGVIFFLGAISLLKVMVPSPKVVINFPRPYKGVSL